jgi:hypothetical protein
MGPMNAYKDMLDNVVSPITCVSMNHQNQLEQMANGAMFAIIILCYCLLQLCSFQSSDTTRIWTVGSSNGAKIMWPSTQCTKCTDASS